MKRGQVSTETLFAVIVILLILILTLYATSLRNEDVRFIDAENNARNLCNKISFIVSSFYADEKVSETQFFADQNFTVRENSITVGTYYCEFQGKAAYSRITAGFVKASDTNGTVVFENV